ncbi:serine hydrolase domain-containing protein [Pelagihabitans pacificus]|uniref:serine hydrolase domain-containing protein n=1 Tax=Pelagihabitans pacificus TaxID=2696054 RepID=UPI001EE98959|nr:serine hydrolase domain-containing protein [Pelagihabitans pacificus]
MLKYRLSPLLFIVISFIQLNNCSSPGKEEIENFQGIYILKDSIDYHVKTKMQELKIPGASLAIINKGKIVHHQTYGYANLEEKIKVTKKTIFEGASISKSIFSFFVMKYVEEGRLDLDKPLFEYLAYPDIAHDERYKAITARMVLSHRSGFPNWRENEPDKKLKIKFEPGTDFEYSGEGYQYLAMVLKEMDGGNWADLESKFQNKVAKPLNMEHTVFIPTEYMEQNKAEP